MLFDLSLQEAYGIIHASLHRLVFQQESLVPLLQVDLDTDLFALWDAEKNILIPQMPCLGKCVYYGRTGQGKAAQGGKEENKSQNKQKPTQHPAGHFYGNCNYKWRSKI